MFGFAASDNFGSEEAGECEVYKLYKHGDFASAENKGNLQEGEFEGIYFQIDGVR